MKYLWIERIYYYDTLLTCWLLLYSWRTSTVTRTCSKWPSADHKPYTLRMYPIPHWHSSLQKIANKYRRNSINMRPSNKRRRSFTFSLSALIRNSPGFPSPNWPYHSISFVCKSLRRTSSSSSNSLMPRSYPRESFTWPLRLRAVYCHGPLQTRLSENLADDMFAELIFTRTEKLLERRMSPSFRLEALLELSKRSTWTRRSLLLTANVTRRVGARRRRYGSKFPPIYRWDRTSLSSQPDEYPSIVESIRIAPEANIRPNIGESAISHTAGAAHPSAARRVWW